MTASVGRGRPRSEQVDEAVRIATHELLVEVGYGGLAIEQIAARAGVGKAAIYRRWRSKAELIFAQVVHDLDLSEPEDTGSLCGDLTEMISGLLFHLSTPAARRALPGIIAHLTDDAELAARFAETFNARERAILATVLERAVTRGELAGLPDPVRAHVLIVGPIFMWLYVYRREPSNECAALFARAATEGILSLPASSGVEAGHRPDGVDQVRDEVRGREDLDVGAQS